MELFVKIVNDLKSLIIFTKNFILDAGQGSKYPSAEYKVDHLSTFAILHV